jgi:hypothetical protein
MKKGKEKKRKEKKKVLKPYAKPQTFHVLKHQQKDPLI